VVGGFNRIHRHDGSITLLKKKQAIVVLATGSVRHNLYWESRFPYRPKDIDAPSLHRWSRLIGVAASLLKRAGRTKLTRPAGEAESLVEPGEKGFLLQLRD